MFRFFRPKPPLTQVGQKLLDLLDRPGWELTHVDYHPVLVYRGTETLELALLDGGFPSGYVMAVLVNDENILNETEHAAVLAKAKVVRDQCQWRDKQERERQTAERRRAATQAVLSTN